MKKKNVILICCSILVIIVFYLLFIRKNSYEIGTDTKLFESSNVEETNNKIKLIAQNNISSQGIKIEEIISGIKDGKNIDTRFLGTNKLGDKINIFSRVNKDNIAEIKNLVIEDSMGYNSTGNEGLKVLKGNYIVLKGDGYNRITNVITGP